jgi:riboflavin kinase/FMN adenylyltransferase
MELVRLTPGETVRWPAPAVAVGNLDGVHRGHQALVGAAIADARSRAGTAVVLTFDPHPSHVLFPDRAAATLMTLPQKAEVLAALGVERLAVLEFTLALAARSAEEFAREVLLDTLGARSVVVGANFRFGRGRGGDAQALRGLGTQLGFEVRVVEPVLEDGQPVSSTRVRDAVESGAMDAAARLLGRRYWVDGTVVEGDRRGRTLGFPTANLAPENDTIPAGGVYAGWGRLLDAGSDQPPRAAAINIGRRPTFAGQATRIEAHLLDFEGDLYGRRLRLEFAARLRPERRFEGAEALKEQILDDVARARTVLRAPSGEW